MTQKLPVLALSGLLNDERLWDHQAQAFASDHPFTVVSLTSHDSVAALAARALSLAPAGRFALAGFSLGGYVALEIMRQAPERVAALALVNTGARTDTAQTTLTRKAAIAAARGPAGPDAVFAEFLPRILLPAHLNNADIVALLNSMSAAVGVDGFERQQTAAMNRPDSRPTLKTINCPTVVICGRQDLTTPLELSDEMVAHIANARLMVIEDCGHMAPMEKPDAVTSALRKWLSSVAA